MSHKFVTEFREIIMKIREYLIEEKNKIEKAKDILKLLHRDTSISGGTKSDKQRKAMSRINYKWELKKLNLSKKEIDDLVKWQEKMGLNK